MRFLRVCLLTLAIFLGRPGIAQDGELREPADLNNLVVACTSNLQTLYAAPIAERRLKGAAFIDNDLRHQTLAACQDIATRDSGPTHLLWLAFAQYAGGDPQSALQTLGRIAPPDPGAYGLVHPAVRAADMRRAILDLSAPVQMREFSYLSPLTQGSYPSPSELLSLAQNGLISADQLHDSLAQDAGYLTLLDIYQGLFAVDADGGRLGPDLLALREVSAAMAASQDPLTSVRGLVQAGGFYGRGYDAQNVPQNQEQAQEYIERAFKKGFHAWFDLGQPEAYRDSLMAQIFSLAKILINGDTDQTTMETLIQAVAIDWAGLQFSQGIDIEAVQARAIEQGSILAAAEQILPRLDPEDIDLENQGKDEIHQQLLTLAKQDPCVYDIWAQAVAAGVFGEPDIPFANDLFRQGQNAGKIGAFVGGGNLHRWGMLAQGYDFDTARALYKHALSFTDTGVCSFGDKASANLQLAWMAYTGQGGGQNLVQARELFHEAMQRGSFSAAEALADMYFFGLGVPQDIVIANDLAVKAYLWNRQENLQWVAQTFHQDLVAPVRQFNDEGQPDLPTLSRDKALAELWEAANRGNFYGQYYLGLAAMANPEETSEIGVPWKGSAYLQALDSHVGFFERGYTREKAQRQDWFENMRAELAGQINLTFTSARHDTQAAIAHDPVRALAFYQSIAPTNPTAQKLLDVDRYKYLSHEGKALVEAGPVNLADIISLGLSDELAPLPLHMLLIP